MAETWDALDELVAEIEAANSGWVEAREQRGRERAAFGTFVDQIDVHLRDFDPGGALDQIRERLLGGAGFVERVTTVYNLDRLFLLRWPAAADPRPELAAAAGEYHIEVWLGLGEQFRPRVRVVGAKRLEAPLPVSAEKFRSVLLSAVRHPAFAPHSTGEGFGEPEGSDAPEQPLHDEARADTASESGQHAPADAAAAGGRADSETPPRAADHEPKKQAASRDSAEAAGQSTSNNHGQAPEMDEPDVQPDMAAPPQPPGDDTPIPMGPAATGAIG